MNDAQTFAKSVNGPVLPPFLSVVFDPTLRKRGETELMGYYQYDDEGVKARRVTVVDAGILKTFLLDRAPVRTFVQSNGHGRAEPGYAPVSRQSNLIVESNRTVSNEALMNLLRENRQAVRLLRQHRRRIHHDEPRRQRSTPPNVVSRLPTPPGWSVAST